MSNAFTRDLCDNREAALHSSPQRPEPTPTFKLTNLVIENNHGRSSEHPLSLSVS